MGRRRWVTLVLPGLFVASLLTSPGIVHAQEMDDLIAEMEQVSQEVSARNEEVKTTELDIQLREDSISQLRDRQEAYRRQAEEAAVTAEAHRGDLRRIAQTRYRGTVVDPLTVAISGENPQHAIDRVSYLNSLTRNTSDIIEGLTTATDEAAENLGEVNRLKAEADFQLGQLRMQLQEQIRDREELDLKKEEIQLRVDNLTEELRQQWVEKNDPVAIDVADFAATSGGAVQAALSKLGAPYGWGSVGPDQFDCSGLIYWAFQQQGKTLPRTSQAQMEGGTPVERDELQPGDVIGYYPGATHVGLYIGDGKIVHASDYGIPVQVVSVDSAPFYGARRY
ncbi:NlpC/P60 family protein [Corynebacterium gallinarum]|uniref:C40 family peptidase n=1 Tax=Corynebacterium gallinarum TaxID=2762214 RepID=A0A8I0LB80_9CORY|nr:NlpC/P60 family protein [Corynebacterium gallinarum]MBD8028966.1 C40 family peptidase [Corynebacterium gallinarum]